MMHKSEKKILKGISEVVLKTLKEENKRPKKGKRKSKILNFILATLLVTILGLFNLGQYVFIPAALLVFAMSFYLADIFTKNTSLMFLQTAQFPVDYRWIFNKIMREHIISARLRIFILLLLYIALFVAFFKNVSFEAHYIYVFITLLTMFAGIIITEIFVIWSGLNEIINYRNVIWLFITVVIFLRVVQKIGIDFYDIADSICGFHPAVMPLRGLIDIAKGESQTALVYYGISGLFIPFAFCSYLFLKRYCKKFDIDSLLEMPQYGAQEYLEQFVTMQANIVKEHVEEAQDIPKEELKPEIKEEMKEGIKEYVATGKFLTNYIEQPKDIVGRIFYKFSSSREKTLITFMRGNVSVFRAEKSLRFLIFTCIAGILLALAKKYKISQIDYLLGICTFLSLLIAIVYQWGDFINHKLKTPVGSSNYMPLLSLFPISISELFLMLLKRAFIRYLLVSFIIGTYIYIVASLNKEKETFLQIISSCYAGVFVLCLVIMPVTFIVFLSDLMKYRQLHSVVTSLISFLAFLLYYGSLIIALIVIEGNISILEGLLYGMLTMSISFIIFMMPLYLMYRRLYNKGSTDLFVKKSTSSFLIDENE